MSICGVVVMVRPVSSLPIANEPPEVGGANIFAMASQAVSEDNKESVA